MATAEFSWQVPATHPAFAGHFPGRPIVPGVVLVDRAILFASQLAAPATGGWEIGNAKFHVPVGPDQALRFVFEPRKSGGFSFRIEHDGELVSSGTLTPLP